ncbi:hypothetical protein B9Z55_021549 [Caenorhabditis nigoni]|uniref:Uncharacterized protein n=1 Tax=Caenorhabditis nigoni TaxID=1611254 RepID=A0A2G5TSG9_9PELO|nr:hypothetical protein B9Z55_021549 [Caenorhabditis nigoni]
MWEMTWDETLASEAGKVVDKVHQRDWNIPTRTNNYSVFFTTSVENLDQKRVREYENRQISYWKSDHRFDLDRSSYSKVPIDLDHPTKYYEDGYTPTQRLIGCAPYHQPAYMLPDGSHPPQYDLFCLVGPYGTQLGEIHYGLPTASMCEPEGVADADGVLCIDKKYYVPPLTTKPPTKEKTSENVPEKSKEDDEEYDLVLWLDAAGDKKTFLSFLLILVIMIVV